MITFISITFLISEFTENCALLGYYAASSGNFLPTFQDDQSAPIFMESMILDPLRWDR